MTAIGVWAAVWKLRNAFSEATSELPEQWTPDNPSIGQCHVSALVLQDLYGGDIICGYTFSGSPAATKPTGHFWNVIDGVTIDITRDQFPLHATITPLGIAAPPLTITRVKADLLARLAGVAPSETVDLVAALRDSVAAAKRRREEAGR